MYQNYYALSLAGFCAACFAGFPFGRLFPLVPLLIFPRLVLTSPFPILQYPSCYELIEQK
jgi:hypothetical protein